jgi:hypothetical protein
MSGRGVVVFQSCFNSTSDQAESYEHCMILAMGGGRKTEEGPIIHLSNVLEGSVHGIVAGYTTEKKMLVGCYLIRDFLLQAVLPLRRFVEITQLDIDRYQPLQTLAPATTPASTGASTPTGLPGPALRVTSHSVARDQLHLVQVSRMSTCVCAVHITYSEYCFFSSCLLSCNSRRALQKCVTRFFFINYFVTDYHVHQIISMYVLFVTAIQVVI